MSELDLSVDQTLDMTNIDPSKDGIDHIRINLNDTATLLGERLFIDHTRVFYHPRYGSFISISAAVTWYKLKNKDENIRSLCGARLREYVDKQIKSGENEYEVKFIPDSLLEEFLVYSIMSKPDLLEMLMSNKLPYVAYYFDSDNKFKMRDKQMTRILNNIKPKLVDLNN